MTRRRTLTVAIAGTAASVLAGVAPSMFASAASPRSSAAATTTAAPVGATAPVVPTTTAGGPATTVGGPTTTAGGPTTTSDGFTVPSDYATLVDDTGRITVAVPPTWTDITTDPTTVDGNVIPMINAAPDLQAWEDTFDVAGMQYAAFPYTANPQTLINRFGLGGGCAASTTVDYADGVFTGTWAQWTQCGDGAAEWHLIAASPGDASFTALVIVQLTGPQDQEAFDVVLNTFNVTPSATWPVPAQTGTTTPGSTSPVTTTPTVSSVPATVNVPPPPSTAPVTTAGPATAPSTTAAGPTTPATTAAVPSSTAPGPATTTLAAGIQLIDETNFLTVTVPADWVDQNISNSRHDDGSERATITAAPDIGQFYDTWEGPGLHMVAVPSSTEPAAMLARFAYPNSCSNGGAVPFDDGRFVGQRQTWSECGGNQTRVVNIAARPLDDSFTIFIQVQQVTPDDAALDQILSTFGTLPGAVYPEPPVVAPLTAAGPVPAALYTAPATPLTNLTDDEGTLSFSVPADWTDTDIGVLMNDDASDRSRIAAAPVLDDFYNDWAATGVQVVAYPFTDNPSALLHNLGYARQCTDGGVQSFDDGTFTGLMQTWTECGDTASRNIVLAISPKDQSVTVFVDIQLPDADNAALQAVLSSLRVA